MNAKKSKFLTTIISGGSVIATDDLDAALEEMDRNGYDIVSIVPNTFSIIHYGSQQVRTDFVIVGRLKISRKEKSC